MRGFQEEGAGPASRHKISSALQIPLVPVYTDLTTLPILGSLAFVSIL